VAKEIRSIYIVSEFERDWMKTVWRGVEIRHWTPPARTLAGTNARRHERSPARTPAGTNARRHERPPAMGEI